MRHTPAPAAEELIARTQERVRAAKGLQAIAGRELLEDPHTNPDMHPLKERLSRQRQERALRRRHRAEIRRQELADYDERMDERGHRLLRRQQLADSPARRAATLARLQAGVLAAAVPVIAGLGLTSTAAVHEAMATYAHAAAWAAWGMEPALMVLVSGIIVTRSILAGAGVGLPGAVTWIERGALATSVGLAWAGAGIGAAIAPVAAAVVALAVERILTAIRQATRQIGRAAAQGPAAPAEEAEAPGSDGWTPAAVAEQAAAAEAAEGIRALEDLLDTGQDTPEGGRPGPSRQEGADTPPPPASGPGGRADQRDRTRPDSRQRVVDALAADPSASVRQIAAATGVSRSRVHELLREIRAEEAAPDGRPDAASGPAEGGEADG